MGRYSSDSETSRSSKSRKTKKSSRRSSSRSESPKHSKRKSKKSKKSEESSKDIKHKHSSDHKSKHSHRSHSNSDRHRKRSRSKSRHHSSSKDGCRKRNDTKNSKQAKSKKKRHSSSSHSSFSSSSSSRSKSPPKRRFSYDPDELLQKLNKAAIEAMAANKKLKAVDHIAQIEMQIKRQDTINELRASGSGGLVVQKMETPTIPIVPPTPPLLSSKITESDDAPVIVDFTFSSLSSNQPSQPSTNESLLHPNFFLETQEEKLNRWIRKLYQFRQRAMSGETFMV